MSQQFGADAVQNANSVSLAVGVETQVVLGNFVIPPFGNCKAKVSASVKVTGPGTTSTTQRIRIFRNPTAENVQVYDSGNMALNTTAAALFMLMAQAIDQIPDGRSVQYQVLVTLNGTGAAGAGVNAYVETTLISG